MSARALRLLLWLALGWALPAAAQQEARVEPQPVKLPLVMDGKPVEVAAHLYKPPGDGPFPLVIYSHGRSGNPAERARLEYPMAVGHGNYWLRRGFTVVAPVRVGYGATGGPDVEHPGTRWRGAVCDSDPDFTRAALNARRTVAAVHEWAVRQPWVRADRILLVGQSMGGMTAVAAGAANLPGVVGAVNFAGGAGGHPSVSPGRSCKPEALADTWRSFGREIKVPNLWLYAANDQYWGAETPKAWHDAFKEGGSDTELVMTPALEGRDGHQLLLHGARLWSPPLDAFLRRIGLTAP